MRSLRSFSWVVISCLLISLLPGCNNPPAPQIIMIDPTHSYSFEGWGTSLAWWAEAVGHWPDANKRARLEDALFNPDTGLGLNIVRYNFGASSPVSDRVCSQIFNKQRFGRYENIPTFQPRQPTFDDLGYDWTQDQAQQTVLIEAKAHGANIFEGFANSAPGWMLSNGCPQGNGNADNLDPSFEMNYANYLATIVQHFHDTLHITFRTVEPFNEPDLPWPADRQNPKNTYQEGMTVDIDQQKRVIQDLYTALQENGASSYTAISAADDNSVGDAVNDYNSYGATIQRDLSQLNTHSYHGDQSDLSNFYQLSQQSGKRIWMSEYTTDGTGFLGPLCIPSSRGSTPLQVFSALDLSCKIGRDLRLMHPQAWVYWQAVEKNSGYYGLLQTPFLSNDKNYQLFNRTKQYYALWQYSHFIRPGYQIIRSADPNAVVAYDPSSKTLVIVVTNSDSTAPRALAYDLSSLGLIFPSASVYQTTASRDGVPQAAISISRNQLAASVPPQSITTYVLAGMPSPSDSGDTD